MKNLLLPLFIVFVFITSPLFNPAFAQVVSSDTSSVPVSAKVGQSCTISTSSAIAFGWYDPIQANATTPLNAIGLISVTCTKGSTGMTVGIGNGQHSGGTSTRYMVGTTTPSLLSYTIGQPSSNAAGALCTFPAAVPWCTTGAGLLSIVPSPDSVARVYSICGTVPGGQSVPVDQYSDTIIATINF